MRFINKYVDDIWLWLIVFIGVAGFLVFYLLPFVLGFVYSTFDLLDNRFVGLTHYRNLLSNELFRVALFNTARFTLLSLGLVMTFGFGLAYVINFSPVGRFVPRGLLLLPLAIPAVGISFVWYWLFHFRGYLSGVVYHTLGITLNLFSGVGLYIPLLVLFLWRYAGFSIFIYVAGMSHLQTAYIDAFKMESKSHFQFMKYVLIPHEHPRTIYLLLLNLIFSTTIFRDIHAIWASYPPRALYMVQHFVHNNFLRLQYERAATGGVILAGFILAILAGIMVYSKRYES